tara:strand:+ start:164 stop:1333 length:1170 start_codon:yes stop_codon:yes gene_type:complete
LSLTKILPPTALSGFKKIDVIDMDTIDVSNLNRQFLFTASDVGQSKALCAANAIKKRIGNVEVTPHFCRIEEKPDEWYEKFHVIVMGLDSIEARSYINKVACSFLKFEKDGSVDQSTIKPMIDGGTEGFKGHARVLLPGVTPCFECTKWLFPPQVTFPLCTLAETPRIPSHCIEFARLILWQNEGLDMADNQSDIPPFDGDDPKHVKWVFDKAFARATQFNIDGVTLSLTQGVVKNIIPAIPSTNAIVAAACTTETLKLATTCSPGMENYMMFNGTRGVYTHTVAYEKDEGCVACGAGKQIAVPADATLEFLLKALIEYFPGELFEPSVSYPGGNLYLRGVLESSFAHNLTRTMKELCQVDETSNPTIMLAVNDKKMKHTMRVRLVFQG